MFGVDYRNKVYVSNTRHRAEDCKLVVWMEFIEWRRLSAGESLDCR